MSDQPIEETDERGDPVFDRHDILSGLVIIAWVVAAIIAFVQASAVGSDDQSPIEALVIMAPWLIVALGLTSVHRLFD